MDYVNASLLGRNIREAKLGWTFWGSWGVGVWVGVGYGGKEDTFYGGIFLKHCHLLRHMK